MRIGLIGRANEPHCRRVKQALAELGVETLHIDASTFDQAHRFGFRDGVPTYNGEAVDDVSVFYLRSILSPVPEVYVQDDEFRFYEDWHQSYMLAREQHGFLLSWLLALLDRGQLVINPPRQATISLLKPYQQVQLQRLGFPTPRTLMTNDPAEAQAFIEAVGNVVCKPVMGGAFCERVTEETIARLPLIVRSPVIFQEQVAGPDIRVTAVRGKVLSAVTIESDQVDFRATEAYEQGLERYIPVQLPPAVEEMCFQAMEATDLYFSGIDLKQVGPEEYVILELNFSPAWEAIQVKTRHRIGEGLARYMVYLAEVLARGDSQPTASPTPSPERRQSESFFHYGLPRPSEVARGS